mgnify:CR=1 FL=1
MVWGYFCDTAWRVKVAGMSYIAGSEVPAVVVDVMRGGPGLGNIAPSQGDYNQIVKGGGHGDYRPIVLAPATVQELIDLTMEAFDLAEKYRCLAIVLADGSLGQLMEPAEMPPMRPVRKPEERPAWSLTGAKGRQPNAISSIYIDPVEEEQLNLKLMAKQAEIEAHEVRFKEMLLEDARLAVVAFGTAGRVAQSASSLYARNLFSFIETMVDKPNKALAVNWDDELVKATALTRDGAVIHPNFQPKA